MVISTLNENALKAHFEELGLFDLIGIFTRSSGRRNYEKNKDSTTVLDALRANNLIYDYYVDERNSERYVIIKNKPRGKETVILD